MDVNDIQKYGISSKILRNSKTNSNIEIQFLTILLLIKKQYSDVTTAYPYLANEKLICEEHQNGILYIFPLHPSSRQRNLHMAIRQFMQLLHKSSSRTSAKPPAPPGYANFSTLHQFTSIMEIDVFVYLIIFGKKPASNGGSDLLLCLQRRSVTIQKMLK